MTAGKRCPATHCPTIIPKTARYCPKHARNYNTRRGTPTARGYGPQHRRLRAKYQNRIDNGEQINCAQCGKPITEPWDLGHTPDRTTWTGPEHQHCNRKAGGHASGGRPQPNRK